MSAAEAATVGDGEQLQLHSGTEHQALVVAVDAWAGSLASPNTRRAYRRAVERLIEEYGEVTATSLAQLRDDMADQGARPATIRQAMVGVLSCTRWLAHSGLIGADLLVPLERVPRPRSRDTRPPRAPTPEQVLALRQIAPAIAFPDDPLRQAHATAIVALLAGTGLRVSEAVALLHAQIRNARPRVQLLAAAQGRPSSTAAAIEVLNGKGGADRTVPAGLDVLRPLQHLAKLADLPAGRNDPVIPALAVGGRGGRIVQPVQHTTARTIARVLSTLAAAIDLEPGSVYPHALRHAYALAQLDPEQRADGKALPLGVLQRRLGHSSPATTALYLVASQDPDFA